MKWVAIPLFRNYLFFFQQYNFVVKIYCFIWKERFAKFPKIFRRSVVSHMFLEIFFFNFSSWTNNFRNYKSARAKCWSLTIFILNNKTLTLKLILCWLGDFVFPCACKTENSVRNQWIGKLKFCIKQVLTLPLLSETATGGVIWKKVFLENHKIHKKTPLLDSLF